MATSLSLKFNGCRDPSSDIRSGNDSPEGLLLQTMSSPSAVDLSSLALPHPHCYVMVMGMRMHMHSKIASLQGADSGGRTQPGSRTLRDLKIASAQASLSSYLSHLFIPL